MSITPSEAQEEAALEQLYAEFNDEAIEEFRSEKLQSYYLDNQTIVQIPSQTLAEARSLLATHPRAAFILAAITIEVGLKKVTLQPVVYGLVHSKSAAVLITGLALHHNMGAKFYQLLRHVLNEHGGIDLETLTRDGVDKSLWKEAIRVFDQRHRVVHEAAPVRYEEAEHAIQVASYILESLIPSLLDGLGLIIDENAQIREKWKSESEKLMKQFRTGKDG